MSTSTPELPLFNHLIGSVIDPNHNCDICKEEAMRYAIVLRTDGTAETVEYPDEVSKQAELFGSIVGGRGIFDAVSVPTPDSDSDQFTIWVNDEGLLLDMPYNEAASTLNGVGLVRRGFSEEQAQQHSHLVGDAVVTWGVDEHGDCPGFSKDEAETLVKFLTKMELIAG